MVTSRSVPQHTGQIFSLFAGQYRVALRFPQIGQVTICPLNVLAGIFAATRQHTPRSSETQNTHKMYSKSSLRMVYVARTLCPRVSFGFFIEGARLVRKTHYAMMTLFWNRRAAITSRIVPIA